MESIAAHSEIERIIDKCRGESIPPCQAACPAGIRVRDYIVAVSRRDYEAALEVILERIPFPSVCGRICPHPCEEKCYRGMVDEPIAICDLKRFVAERINNRLPVIDIEPKQSRIAIIGAGPAGLTAAYHLALSGYPVTVFESRSEPGGMLTLCIPEYKLPREVVQAEIEHIESLGVKIITNAAIGSIISFDSLFQQGFQAIFIATGTPHSRTLRIRGEVAGGVFSGLDFLRELKLGRKFEVGKKIAVIGGGDVAIDVARCAVRLGLDVHILYRRSRQEMPASNEEVEAALEEGVKLECLATPKEIIAQDGKGIALVCQRTRLGQSDGSGRCQPVPIRDSEFRTEVDMVIVAVGQRPRLSFLPDDIQLTESGLIAVDPVTLATSRSGVFAGGDVQSGAATAIEAMAAGRKAAISIMRYLTGKDLRGARGDEEQLVLPYLEKRAEHRPRLSIPKISLEERKRNFSEVKLGLSEEAAREEATRCLSCECRTCMEECEFLKRNASSPKRLAEGFKDGSLLSTPLLPYLCNLCGLCERVCPEGLNIGKMCLSMRFQLANEGLAPLPQHRRVIAEQEWVTSDAFALTLPDPSTSKCERFFFPGCSLSARSPGIVIKTLEYLQKNLPGTGIILGCCGAPTHDLGDQNQFKEIIDGVTARMDRFGASELIIACPECYSTFAQNAPHLTLKSVYEIIADHGLPEVGKAGGNKTFAIHDSCKTRYEDEIQDSIRILVKDLGYDIEEMKYSRDMTRCCGMGGMVPFVDLGLWHTIAKKRASETPHDIITYCAGCQAALASTGKPTVHILDLLFSTEGGETTQGIALSRAARQQNQSRLRSELIAMNGRVLRQ